MKETFSMFSGFGQEFLKNIYSDLFVDCTSLMEKVTKESTVIIFTKSTSKCFKKVTKLNKIPGVEILCFYPIKALTWEVRVNFSFEYFVTLNISRI